MNNNISSTNNHKMDRAAHRALMRSTEAATVSHTHSNKAILDSIDQNDLDTIYENSERLSYHQLHGIISGMNITINANPRYFNIASGIYYINGIKKVYNGAIIDTISISGGNFASAIIDINGLVTLLPNQFPSTSDLNDGKLELTAFSKTDTNTINKIGNSFFLSLDFIKKIYIRSKFFEGTIFSLQAGLITQNISNPLHLDIAEGQINTPNAETKTITQTLNIVAQKMYNISGQYQLQPETTLVVDIANYDNGTDLALIPNNKYVTHTISRSSRTETIYFTYGTIVYNKLTDAINANPNLGIFNGDIGSEIEPLSLIIIDQGTASIAEIVDIRNKASKLISSSSAQDIGWKDNVVPFTLAIKGASAPSEATDSNGFVRLAFSDGNEVFIDYHVNHDYARGTSAYIHIHWMPTTTMTLGETVIWNISYIIAKGHQQGESLLATPVSFTITHISDGTEVAGEHMVTECSDIDAFDLIEPDTVVSIKVQRGTDTYGSNVYGLMADLHYQADRDSTLNKAPDFYT